jgi:uncharacterized protein (TIGR03067 family)
MRSTLILASMAVLLMALSAGRADDKPEANPDPDLRKLQGKWEIAYHETGGEVDTEETKWVMEVRGDRYTFTDGKVKLNGRVRLDSSCTPKRLEYATQDGDDVQEYSGIYELDGDRFKTCDVEKGRPRPTEFKTKDPTGQVAVWKRVKVKD